MELSFEISLLLTMHPMGWLPPSITTHVVESHPEIFESRKNNNKYKGNGGITLPGTNFVGPGNNLVDNNGKSNFTRLPDHCADWVAMENDADYYNASVTNKNQIHDIENIDNKAINMAWNECLSTQPIITRALVAGLQAKQHLELLAEQSVYPFGSNNAVYPGSSDSVQTITWFNKSNSRRRNSVGKHAFSLLWTSTSRKR